MYHPTDRITHNTAFVTPVVGQEIAQWVHPMKDQSDDPSRHERTLLPRSYISLLNLNDAKQSDAGPVGLSSIFSLVDTKQVGL